MIKIQPKTITTSSNQLTIQADGFSNTLSFDNGVFISPVAYIIDKFVFERGKTFPLILTSVTCPNTSSTSTFDFNLITGQFTNISNATLSHVQYDYITQLCKLITTYNIPLTVTVMQSSVTTGTTVATTELNYFNTNRSFNSSAYSYSNRAPSIKHTDVTIGTTEFSSTVAKVYLSNNTLKFTNVIRTYPIYIAVCAKIS